MLNLNVQKAARGVGFMLGMDIGYNVGSFSLSAPQTTERRIKDMEGKQETPKEAMGWVWISSIKIIVYTALGSFLSGNWWPFIGGLVVVADVHGSYRYAIARGKKACTPGGKLVDAALTGSAPPTGPLFRRP